VNDRPDDSVADAGRHLAGAARQVARRASSTAPKDRTDARLAELERTARLLAQTLGQLAGRLTTSRPALQPRSRNSRWRTGQR
jgi:hypothetical protein